MIALIGVKKAPILPTSPYIFDASDRGFPKECLKTTLVV